MCREHETEFGTREQQQGASSHVGQDVGDASWLSCSRAEQASLAPQPCSRAQARLRALKTAQFSLNCKKAAQISWRNDRARGGHGLHCDVFESKGGFWWLTSAGKLQVPKNKLSLDTLMSRIRFGRSERAVHANLTNGILDKRDFKLLRNCLKQVREARFSFVRYFGGLLILVPQVLLEGSCLQLTITVADFCKCRHARFSSNSGHVFFLGLMVSPRPPSSSKLKL